MKKYKTKKVHGVKVVTRIHGMANRPVMPRPAVFRKETNYDRNREKARMRKDLAMDS